MDTGLPKTRSFLVTTGDADRETGGNGVVGFIDSPVSGAELCPSIKGPLSTESGVPSNECGIGATTCPSTSPDCIPFSSRTAVVRLKADRLPL